MKITFEKDILIAAVTPAMSAVSDKNTISSIEGILFTTVEGSACTLSTYDLEKGFRTTIPAQVNEGGSYIINAAKFFRIIRTMPERYITVEVNDKNQVKIRSGKSEFSLSALPGNEFPNLPELTGEKSITLQQKVLRKTVSQISHAIGSSEQRAVLGGAFFRISGDTLQAVACDGNRLAVREKICQIKSRGLGEGEEQHRIGFIVPGKTLSELCKMISDSEKEIVMTFGRKHIIFAFDDILFYSRMIDGEYIDYERVIPKDQGIHVTIDRLSFIESLERASLVTDDKSLGQVRSYVKCIFEDQILKVNSVSTVSAANDEIEIEKEGSDLTIGFNCRFLLDALRSISEDKIRLSMSTPLMSMVIEKAETENESEDDKKESEKGSYLYMVCPVKMKE
ncbi:MAG: DNA polymerase III subunit beta [Ruminococcaceae bacterium]|nr:DNA polymerase III subunit beta [Oscillospiraceae bacterium]